MDAVAPITLAEARALLRDYVNAIDRGRLAEWPNFFVEACSYRITTRENEERGFPLSIMLCNNRAMLFDRIEATEKANIFEPHSYRHILSDSEVVAEANGALMMRTSFLCVRIMNTGSKPFSGPLYLVVDNLSSNATLLNGAGVTQVLAPLGSPYVAVTLDHGTTLAPGDSAVAQLLFSDPSGAPITYSTRVLAVTPTP